MKTSPGYKKEAEPKEESGEVHDDFSRTQENVSIRKIDNGYIVSKSWQQKGKNGTEYKNEEYYSKENPVG